jgi:sortase A
MDWRRIVGGIGRTLIGSGLLILLFVAYQLWGTGLAEARSQDKLKQSFENQLAQLATTTTTTGPIVTVPGATTTSTSAPMDLGPPPPPEGEAVAIIKIPKIGVEKRIVQGVSLPQLKKGPGHYPSTPMPGQPGNAAIAGHRTTYGAPFFNLEELAKGDPILVTTLQGRFVYEVSEVRIVKPSQVDVLSKTEDNRLTLTTCNPRFSAAQRLIVVAMLAGEAAAPSPLPPPDQSEINADPGEDQGAPGSNPDADQQPVPGTGPTTPGATTTEPGRTSIDDDPASLSGERAARGPAFRWGFLAFLVGLLTWVASRKWRRWPAYLLGAPVFLVVLFVFFENFSRLLPSNF